MTGCIAIKAGYEYLRIFNSDTYILRTIRNREAFINKLLEITN